MVHALIAAILFQMVRKEPLSKAADVYCYGILLWEIITQKVPFSDVNSYEVPAKVAAGEVGKVNITV